MTLFKYAKAPSDKRITIETNSTITLADVISHLEFQGDDKLSPDLKNALVDLKLQRADPELQETKVGGRDAKLRTFVLSKDELRQLSYLSQDLWNRFVEYRYKFKVYPRNLSLNHFPIVVSIEPTSVCNVRCQMCFQSDMSFSRNKSFMGYMSFDLYKQIVDEMVENQCDSLVFASRGEPTLHPRFPEMVAYATKRILDVKINTNATMLNEQLTHSILEAEPNLLVFSIDSADKAQFEEIRKGAKWSRVFSNIKRFQETRAKYYANTRTITRVSGTIFRDDQDTEQIRRFWSQYVDQVALHQAWPFWDSYNAPLTEIKNPCGLLWERMYIWYDGTCNPCDIDYKSLLSMGVVNKETSVKDIWLGEKAQRLRNFHKGMQKNSLVPCNRCSGTV